VHEGRTTAQRGKSCNEKTLALQHLGFGNVDFFQWRWHGKGCTFDCCGAHPYSFLCNRLAVLVPCCPEVLSVHRH